MEYMLYLHKLISKLAAWTPVRRGRCPQPLSGSVIPNSIQCFRLHSARRTTGSVMESYLYYVMYIQHQYLYLPTSLTLSKEDATPRHAMPG